MRLDQARIDGKAFATNQTDRNARLDEPPRPRKSQLPFNDIGNVTTPERRQGNGAVPGFAVLSVFVKSSNNE